MFIFKKTLIFFLLTFIHISLSAQSYNQERTKLAMFVERMYNNEPFEGCKIIDDYEHSYLLSVVVLDKTKYSNEGIMNRVAQVKSQRNAGEYFNGAETYSDITIKTPESDEKGGKQMNEVYEIIRLNTMGFVQQMLLLTTFDSLEKNKIFVFYNEIK